MWESQEKSITADIGFGCRHRLVFSAASAMAMCLASAASRFRLSPISGKWQALGVMTGQVVIILDLSDDPPNCAAPAPIPRRYRISQLLWPPASSFPGGSAASILLQAIRLPGDSCQHLSIVLYLNSPDPGAPPALSLLHPAGLHFFGDDALAGCDRRFSKPASTARDR